MFNKINIMYTYFFIKLSSHAYIPNSFHLAFSSTKGMGLEIEINIYVVIMISSKFNQSNTSTQHPHYSLNKKNLGNG